MQSASAFASSVGLLIADEARVQTSRDRRIDRSFDNRAAIGKQCHLIGVRPEFQNEFIVPHPAVGREAVAHFRQVEGALPLVDLDRIPAAQSDVRAPFSRQMKILP